MSIYYKVCDREKREFINPGKIGAGGIKGYAVIFGDTAHVVAWLLFNRRWEKPVYVDEHWDLYYEMEYGFDPENRSEGSPEYKPDPATAFKDVTESTLKEMNSEVDEDDQRIRFDPNG